MGSVSKGLHRTPSPNAVCTTLASGLLERSAALRSRCRTFYLQHFVLARCFAAGRGLYCEGAVDTRAPTHFHEHGGEGGVYGARDEGILPEDQFRADMTQPPGDAVVDVGADAAAGAGADAAAAGSGSGSSSGAGAGGDVAATSRAAVV